MPQVALDTDAGLEAACAIALRRVSARQVKELAALLREVRDASTAERRDKAFQTRLWKYTELWRGGLMAQRNIAPWFLDDEEFLHWFTERTAQYPLGTEERTDFLTEFNEELRTRIEAIEDPQGDGWQPRLEILRTLALFFPEDITALAGPDDVVSLARKMGCSVGQPVLAHRLVLERLRTVLGPPPDGLEGAAERMLLPTKLHSFAFPKIWVVRAGKGGEDEEFVLANDLVMLGFKEEDEPRPEMYCFKEYQELIRHRDPERSRAKADAAARQVWNFAWEIHEGDIVVLPQKKGQRDIAWGTVEGEYERREVGGEPRHTRPLKWVRKNIPRDDFGPDEVCFNHPRTVYSLRDHADRIWPVLDTGLAPLPLSERRILLLFQQKDEFGWLRWMLGLVGDEIDPGTLHELIVEKQPGLARTTTDWKVAAATVLRCVAKEGGRIKITDLGRQVRERDDADVLMGRLLTGIRGADHLLVWLEERPRSKRSLIDGLMSDLKMRNQAAVDLVKFFQNVGVINSDDAGDLSLTERGVRWRKQIHWNPELPPDPQPAPLPPIDDLWEAITRRADEADLRFERSLVEALHLGLWADEQRHFAVLSGLSGTGKTQIALRYAMALTGAESDTGGPVEVIAVHPGWHDPGPLLGYVNPLTGGYARTEFLNFLLEAVGKPEQTHVLILDEMNLSHPEQYFAPILSAMEIAGGEIPLHRGDTGKLGVPTGVAYPKNLVIIGTVNMDETTMGISDKVLDRAFTLEFWDIEPEKWPGWESCGLDEGEKTKVRGLLAALTKTLSPARRHFGWRVIAEVVGFLEGRSRDSGIEIGADAALDQVIYAKVLPKLRGSDTPRFRKCLQDTVAVLEKAKLGKCAEKVRGLEEDLDAAGSCSFWR